MNRKFDKFAIVVMLLVFWMMMSASCSSIENLDKPDITSDFPVSDKTVSQTWAQ